MPLFLASWKPLPDQQTRSESATYFASMTKAMHQKDQMGVNVLCRYHFLGTMNGYAIIEAPTCLPVYKLVWNWSEDYFDAEVKPILDDKSARHIVLKDDPSFELEYEDMDNRLMEGESYYWIIGKIHQEKKIEVWEKFAKMTEEEDIMDRGNNRLIGRWHDLAGGFCYGICASKNELNLYEWLWKWASVADFTVRPCVNDDQASTIMKEKQSFDRKLEALQTKMGAMAA